MGTSLQSKVLKLKDEQFSLPSLPSAPQQSLEMSPSTLTLSCATALPPTMTTTSECTKLMWNAGLTPRGPLVMPVASPTFCDSGAIEGANFESKAWTWSGVYDFANLDTVLGNFLECAQAAAIMTCEDNLRTTLAGCSA